MRTQTVILRSLLTAFMSILMIFGLSSGAAAQPADRIVLEFGSKEKTSELRLSVGRSQIIYSKVALEQVVIGSPEIADIKLLSSRQVLILGIKPGITNLVFRDKTNNLIALMDVVVSYDLTGMKRKISEVLPDENRVQVRGSNDAVILSGYISDALAMEMALEVARSFAPKEKVINLMEVGGGQQVMLEVKISEVQRSSLKQLGISGQVSTGDSDAFDFITGALFSESQASEISTTITDTTFSQTSVFERAVSNAFGSGDFIQDGPSGLFNSARVRLEALEEQGLASVLAEPNLVALSGQEASFLAGGEFPIPVLQAVGSGSSGITIEFKEFGVGLKFKPTVLNDNKINLKLSTEASSLNFSNAFSTGLGVTVPALSTRRAGTTVEMADGQSFAIAGLLQNDMNNLVRKFPILGDMPILGALFRSTDFQRGESELVVVVTARLVKPVSRDSLALPTDNIVPPNNWEQYLLGRLEGLKSDQAPKSEDMSMSAGAGTTAGESGIDGKFGHEMSQ